MKSLPKFFGYFSFFSVLVINGHTTGLFGGSMANKKYLLAAEFTYWLTATGKWRT
jgi:hypothetical protein